MARCFEPSVAQGFVNGSLSEAASREALRHAAGCARCRGLLQAAGKPARELPMDGLDEIQERLAVWRAARRSPYSPEAPLRKGETVDRYVVTRSVAATEDGMIYEAFDPEREQRVVVKQLDVRADDAAAVGLMAIARRLVRFSHPNVLQVLAVGEHGGFLYLVYELVKGTPLSQLGTAAPRALLGLFAQAGRGLAAVHDLGIAHGCFSASSCVVDREGRVKVLDFGVGEARIQRMAAVSAHLDEEWEDTGPPISTEDSFIGFVPRRRAPTAPFESFILAAGPSALGPRRYAAPELIQGAPPSAAADQYAFCAALYHHLYRRPACDGDSIALWLREVLRGQVAAPPVHTEVPGGVYEVLQRGLRGEAAQRFDRMATLVGKLPGQRPLASRRGKAVVAAAIGASALAGVLVARGGGAAGGGGRAGGDGACDPAMARQWQALAQKEQALRGATAAAPPSAALGGWMAGWQRTTRDFCQLPAAASPASASGSSAASLGAASLPGLGRGGDRRGDRGGDRELEGRAQAQLARACASSAGAALADLLQLLEGGRRDRLDRAASAIEALPTAEQCAAAPASAIWPAVVMRAEVRRRLGMLAEADEEIEGAPEGETLPELWWVRGQLAMDRGELLEARRAFEAAAFGAAASGEVALGLSAATRRLAISCAPAERALWRGYLEAHAAAAPRQAPSIFAVKAALAESLACEGELAAASVLRDEVSASLTGAATPAAAAAALASAQGRLAQGELASAEAAAQRAASLFAASYGAHHPMAQLAQLTLVESRLSDPASLAAAEPQIDQIAADAAVRGEADAIRARAWLLRARIAGRRGQLARALDGTRRAVLEYEAALGGAHPELASAVLELADRLLVADRADEAEASYRQVAGILDSLGQGPSAELAHARAGIQLARWGTRPPADAGETLRWGVAPTGGELDPRVEAWAAAQLARRFAARGDEGLAEAQYRRALVAAEASGAADRIALAAAQLALFALSQGLPDALELGERALGLVADSHAASRPQLQAAMARALWRQDRPRARALAEEAAAELGESSAEGAELRQWIKRRK